MPVRLAAAFSAALILSCACGNDSAESGRHSKAAEFPAAARLTLSPHIVVDQFGYRPADRKVAVIRSAIRGYDAPDAFAPGPVYEVRRAGDGQVVFSAAPVAWKDGAVESSSGDKGWWFDYSALAAPGDYFVADARQQLRSATFRIDPHVYRDVLKAATRMFFYQRSGFAKSEPYADACWTDDAAYLGQNQDTEARDITDPGNPAKVRDLSGGWFDAGDTNKYVTKAVPAVHQLLTAYEENPGAFTDDFNIPESGNGIPDVLDEIKWETDWLKKMQYRDGSAALKVGDLGDAKASPPSSDASPRYYVPSCTSATIAVAGMFAHAAYDFGRFPPLAEESAELRARAAAAWRNFSRKPQEFHCDSNAVRSGNADWDQRAQNGAAVIAAVYLFAVTGDDSYQEYLKSHYRESRPYFDFGWTRYEAEQGDALMFYTGLANADAELKSRILADKRADAMSGNGVYGFDAGADLYRAFLHDPQYHWGSNQVRANYANSNLELVAHDAGVGDTAPYEIRALEMLHYFHGVNPFGLVYLTNMSSYGAAASANEIFHSWYGRFTFRGAARLDSIEHRLRVDRIAALDRWLSVKSKWSDARTSRCGPAPGYLPGGPNVNAAENGVPRGISPPAGQPPQKSYKDWNVDWPDASWAVTEPAIYYQSAYVRLLSAFVQ
jgi:endoglucanase